MIKGIYPQHLKIDGRLRLSTKKFSPYDKLYHGFDKSDLDSDKIDINKIRFPDFSCNWGKFSIPQDIAYRKNGKKTDGCYSITVTVSRYKEVATPVHDPIAENDYENYAHVEIRLLLEGESIYTEPPKGRRNPKSKSKKALRMEYRKNIVNNLEIDLAPK